MTIATDERYSDPEQALRAFFASMIVGIWTCIPGYIVSYDPDKRTASVQPGVAGQQMKSDGSVSALNYPVLPDVPVVFPHGGGCTLTFPVKAGDECLVVFASRSIDAWWQSGGIQPPSDSRTHSLADGFAILGPMSQANKISSISTSTTQLRSNDGSTVIDLDAVGKAINITAPAGTTVHADLATTGNLVAGNGASGSFTTPTGQTVTVQDGIVTNIF